MPDAPDAPDTPDTLLADAPLAGAKTCPPFRAFGAFGALNAVPVDAPLRELCAGVAAAVYTLLTHCARPGRTSCIWSERFFPLCSSESRLVSLPWIPIKCAKLVPRRVVIEEYLCTLAARLGTVESDLIVAYVLLENLVRLQPSELRVQTTRPLLLVCVIVAMKIGADAIVTTKAAFECVEDVLDATAADHLGRMEWRLMELLDWRLSPDPEVYETYRLALLGAAR